VKLNEKEYEANKFKKELNIVKSTHDQLIEDNFSRENELEALRDHSSVL